MHKFATHTLIVMLLLSFPAGLFLVYAPESPKPLTQPVDIDSNLKDTAHALDVKEREIIALEKQIVQARGEMMQYGQLREEILKELMALQAKVDGIIERSMDELPKKDVVVEKDAETVAAKVTEKTVAKPIEKTPEKAAPVVEPKVTKLASLNEESKGLGIKIGTPSARVKSGALDVSFDVHNTMQNQKAAGFLWTSVEMRGENGETYFLHAPSAAEIAPNGDIQNPKKAAIFGIHRYKRNSFRLEIPEGEGGTVVGVKIGVSDRQGNHLQVYDFPGG